MMHDIERAFRAGYHCRWHRDGNTWTFCPELAPGDSDQAYVVWRSSPDCRIGFDGAVYAGTREDWIDRAQHAEQLVDDLMAQNLELHEQLARTVDRLELLEEFYKDHSE